jgi:hypothetical protein
VNAWSGQPISANPGVPHMAAGVGPDTPSAVAAMAAAAAAAAGNGGMHDHSAYPAVLRDALAQVPAQAGGVQQMYPTIQPGGVASQFNAAAAAAGGDQVRKMSKGGSSDCVRWMGA